jgi:hypothetical protein
LISPLVGGTRVATLGARGNAGACHLATKQIGIFITQGPGSSDLAAQLRWRQLNDLIGQRGHEEFKFGRVAQFLRLCTVVSHERDLSLLSK